MQSSVQTHYRTCNICEAMCGIEIEYKGKEILSIKGDKKDPLSQGHICPKGVALQDFYKDPDRLRKPLRKTANGGWETISWEVAIDTVANRIKAIQAKHGKNAVATFLGNPNAHNMGNTFFLPFLLKAIGSKNRFSASSVDQLPHHVASNYMFGHGLLSPIPDIDRTNFMMMIGSNPMVSNGSMMTVPNFPKRLKALQARGGKLVVIDPRHTETAEKADQHFFIKPETDALFLAALIHTVFKKDSVRLKHLQTHIKGLEKLKAALQNFSPERVAPITGITATNIKAIATQMLAAEGAVCHSRMGASTQLFGGLCQWLTNALNIVTGNFDCEGGMMFTQPAADHIMASPKKGRPRSYGRYQSRVSGKPYYNGEFPVSVLAEEIETEGEDQIKALLVIAGNPILSTPNGLRLEKAIQQLEFVVSIDIYLNETNCHADIILPVATGLEASNYDVIFHAMAVRNTAKYSPALFNKAKDQRYDWEVIKAITQKLFNMPDNGFTPEMILDNMLQSGYYGKDGLSLEKLKANPHGIDLGALRPCLLQRLQTDDEQIDLAPDLFVTDLTRLENTYFSVNGENTEFSFALIGRRNLRHHNTWTHNSERLKRGRNACTLLMHPKDATAIGIENGETVKITSCISSINIEVELSNEMMQGVVSMPQGWGNRKKTGMKIAAAYGGVSINCLTDETRIDELTGNAALNGTRVKVEKLE